MSSSTPPSAASRPINTVLDAATVAIDDPGIRVRASKIFSPSPPRAGT
jgi:hypothetical protein